MSEVLSAVRAICEDGLARDRCLGDGLRQAAIDFASESVAAAVYHTSAARLDRILDWQSRINLSVLPLSAGEETLAQVRRLLASASPRRRVR